MRVLGLLHSPSGSGSDTTIRRIADHLAQRGCTVLLTPDPEDARSLEQLADRHKADGFIGTHAYLSARSFIGTTRPYVVVFGGTDLNEYVHDNDCRELMAKTVRNAAGLVAFTGDFVERCTTLWPDAASRLHHIPQGVDALARPSTDFSLTRLLGLPEDARIFLLPSGLRPIKDPLLLVDCFRRWHAEDSRIRLIIAGLTYDEDYEEMVMRRCVGPSGVRYIGALARADLLAAMAQSTAVLNSSVSECSPNALLEAMHLGRPVLVRNIPGNTCVVQDGRTGLVFDGPSDFRPKAQRLLADPTLARGLGCEAARYVRQAHSMAAERSAYDHLVRQALRAPQRAAGQARMVTSGTGILRGKGVA
jgi:glycosyltransferase involved in cell wall biosynthesis